MGSATPGRKFQTIGHPQQLLARMCMDNIIFNIPYRYISIYLYMYIYERENIVFVYMCEFVSRKAETLLPELLVVLLVVGF